MTLCTAGVSSVPLTANPSATLTSCSSLCEKAPSTAPASPSPVSVSTPVSGDAATASCPASPSLVTTLDPMSPVPPMTTIFMEALPVSDGVP